MGRALNKTAEELGCSERTLRRYVSGGLLRGRRLGPRRLELPPVEEAYLTSHWRLVSELLAALRTERDVRLAVLFGSTAVGEEGPDSDVDVLIEHRSAEPLVRAGLASRLHSALGRRVQFVTLAEAQASPSLLADVLEEGRVLVDRDQHWQDLLAGRERILAAAASEDEALVARARDAVAAARARI